MEVIAEYARLAALTVRKAPIWTTGFVTAYQTTVEATLAVAIVVAAAVAILLQSHTSENASTMFGSISFPATAAKHGATTIAKLTPAAITSTDANQKK